VIDGQVNTKPEEQIQTALGAHFSASLVPSSVEVTANTEVWSPPLVELKEAAGQVQQDETAERVREIRASAARTLELSKQLDEVLSRPIRWFHRDPDDKSAAIESEPVCDN
jgi:hypothetical protein